MDFDHRKLDDKAHADVRESSHQVSAVEEVLGYKFTNRRLLVEAMTHASYMPRSSRCYQVSSFFMSAWL